MAMIQGPGGFSGQPIGKNNRGGEVRKPAQEGPQESKESFTPSGAVVPSTRDGADARVKVPTEVEIAKPLEVPAPGKATIQTDFKTPATPAIPAEFEGAFLSGPGLLGGIAGAAGISSIEDLASMAGLSDKTFTNGLHSTELVGLSGRPLATLSPWS